MDVNTYPRTWGQVKVHPAVECVEIWADIRDPKYWIYLKAGWSANADPGNVHLGNGHTVREAIADVFPVVPCSCYLCSNIIAINKREAAKQ